MMSWKRSAAAFAVVVVGCMSSAAQAAPKWTGPLGETATTYIVPVGGCHRDERTHFVPEVGRSLPHVHIGDDCDPYRITDSDGGSDDDDDDADDDSSSDDDDDDVSVDAPDVCVEIAGYEVCS